MKYVYMFMYITLKIWAHLANWAQLSRPLNLKNLTRQLCSEVARHIQANNNLTRKQLLTQNDGLMDERKKIIIRLNPYERSSTTE